MPRGIHRPMGEARAQFQQQARQMDVPTVPLRSHLIRHLRRWHWIRCGIFEPHTLGVGILRLAMPCPLSRYSPRVKSPTFWNVTRARACLECPHEHDSTVFHVARLHAHGNLTKRGLSHCFTGRNRAELDTTSLCGCAWHLQRRFMGENT
jgi:hypothetical protein